jgi:hypothetical protein
MAAVSHTTIRDRVASFGALPDDALVDPHTVAALYACSIATLKRRVRAGLLPAPIVVTVNTHRYRAGDIRRALAHAGSCDE